MNWLDFGDLDLIFKVTAVEKLKIHGSRGVRERLCAGVGEGVEPVYSENIVTSYSCIYHCTDSLVLVDSGGGGGGGCGEAGGNCLLWKHCY